MSKVNSVNQSNGKLYVNGKEIEPPNGWKGNTGSSISLVNNVLYINGYQYVGREWKEDGEVKVDGKWKRTIKAIWHMIF